MRARAIKWGLPALVVLGAIGAGAAMAASAAMHPANGTVKGAKIGKYGSVLVNSRGLTLYRYTRDRKGVTRCYGACAATWPPLLVATKAKPTAGTGATARLLGTIARKGGTRQVTYAGFPLYRFAGDRKRGEMNGEGYGGIWYVVNARGGLVKHAMSSGPAPATTAATTTTPEPTTTSGGGGGGTTWG
jgi:predicted lipoprotein with Yx(FWY)xxD motif